jgi:hypothetical protein
MAKAKKELAGNWELVSGGVFHKSWAGVTFRSRGSAGAYYEGCIFPRPPEVPPPPPPPPPTVPVYWEVAVDGYEPEPFQVILIFSVKRFDEVRGEYTHRVERFYDGVELPMLTLEIVSIQYDADTLSKTYHIIFGPPEEPFYEEFFTLSVPPFNMQQMAVPNLDHEQYTFNP